MSTPTILSSVKRFSHETAAGRTTVTTGALYEALLEQAIAGRDNALVRLTAGKHFSADTNSETADPTYIAQVGVTGAAKRSGLRVSCKRDGDTLDVRMVGILNTEAARNHFGDEVVEAALAANVPQVNRDPRGRKPKG